MRITDFLFIGLSLGGGAYFITTYLYSLFSGEIKAFDLKDVLAVGGALYWLVAMVGRKTRESYLQLLHQYRILRVALWAVLIVIVVLWIIYRVLPRGVA